MALLLARTRSRLGAFLTAGLLSSAVLTTSTAFGQPADAPAKPAEAGTGKVVVKEKSGQPIHVFVDGVEMGSAPWSGDVTPGPHEITARAGGVAVIPQRITVEAGKTHAVELVASSQTASVKIGTSDGKGLIHLDGQLVSEGNYIGELPPGTHKLRITREGYDPFEEDLVVKDKDTLARTVTLKLASTITTGTTQESEALEGLYGGFGLVGLLTPGGTGSSIQKDCDSKGSTPTLASCDAPSGMGAGLGGFVGYSWNPVGIELYFAGHYDDRTLKNDYNAASTDLGVGADPARLEEFRIRRAGGMGLARVRVAYNTRRLRFDLAIGAGLSYRVMFAGRVTTDKNNPVLRDAFVSDTPSYLSPVIAFEPSVMYRITPSIAVSLGFQMFFETPSSFLNDNQTPTTTREANHSLGPFQSLRTPAYELASGVQVFMGPVIGMMFGP